MHFEHAQTDYQSYNIPMPERIQSNIENESDEINRQLEAKMFYDKKMRGVFFSYTFNQTLRVYISVDEDTDIYNDEFSSLLHSSINQCNCKTGLLWVRKKTPKIIAFLEKGFNATISDELFFYESKKFVIDREHFKKKFKVGILEIKSYDDRYLDDCLRLWEEAMLFCMPPNFHLNNRAHHFEQFRFYRDYLTFETFWKDGELVGFYWNNGNEVDIMAVSPKFQRMGYGSIILTRAIEMIFQKTNSDIAWLIASSFNEKACSFYTKNNMEVRGEYRIPRIDDPIKSDIKMREEHGVL
ncbi:MAG: GNAT family N-acetyltransferase [Clostridiales bacterium]|jgi:GNAT superfamily N-acetyltransferase|nr:GNAT family N-acetyltransferase [Clostridiales bacterium]